jgi:membrane-bound serine protease (ClpP class)
VTALLLVIGMVGIFKELAAPGTFLGMSLAGLCFALFFWSRYLSGTSGALEIVLFAAGLAFLAVELFVLPGFGVSGVLGILLLLGSLVLACQNFIVPETERELLTLGTTVLLVAGSSLAFLAVAATMVSYIGSIPLLNRLVLAPPTADAIAADTDPSKVAAPLTLQVGDRGTAETPLRPAGRACFAGEFFDVVSHGDFIPRGTAIRIIEFDAHRIVVRADTV